MEPLVFLMAFAVVTGARGQRNRLLPMMAVAFVVAATYFFQRFL